MEPKIISQSKHEKYNKIENFIPILIKDKEHSIKIGSFGEMKLCKNKFNSKYFLIKSIKPNEINEEIVKSINLLYKQSLLMRNKHILKVISIIHTNTHTNDEIHIVYEYFKGVSISEKLMTDASGFFNYTNKMEVLLLFSKIISTVSYIHQKGQVHGSINIENILIDDTFNFKLIGLNNFEDVILNLDPNQNILIDYLTDERLNNKEITVATDFFNLGELLYEMFHGYSPFYPNMNMATTSLIEMIEKNISPNQDQDRLEEIDEELIIQNILQKKYTFNDESKNHPDVISLIKYMIDNNQSIGTIDNIYKLEIIQDVNTYKLRKRYEKHKKQYDINEFSSIEGVNFVSEISENSDESQSDNDLYNNVDDEYDELNYNRNQLNNATKVDVTKSYRLYSYYSNYDTKTNRNSKNNSICLDMITDYHNQNQTRLSKIERDTVGSNILGKQGRTGLLLSKIKESYSTNKTSFGERKLTTRSIIRKEKEKDNNKEIDFNMTIEEKFEEEKIETSRKLGVVNSNNEIRNVS